jgi:UDP:flavonoid glycosyltransferase YjiC (YdhE family)
VRYLFCSFTTPGFLFPMAGMALELRRRGHEAAFVTGPSARPLLDEAGLAQHGDDERCFDIRVWGLAPAAVLGVKQVEEAARRFRPDVLVTHQLCQSALVARERSGLPLAVMGTASYLWPAARRGEAAAPREVESRRHGHLVDNLRLLNEVRALCRLAPGEWGPEDHPLLGDLFLLRTVPRLEPELAAFPARVHAAGACLWEPPRDEAAEWAALRARFAAPDAPLVYAQAGRSFGGPGFWPRLVDALACGPVQVVASTARMDVPAGPLPPNFIAEPHVPQGLVLPRAAAVVCGSTTTAVLGAAAHGVPSLLVPVSSESVTLTHWAERAGCGAGVPAEVDGQGLRRAIGAAMTSEPLRRGARAARAAFGARDGFGAAAGLLERLGRERGPVERADAARPVPASVRQTEPRSAGPRRAATLPPTRTRKEPAMTPVARLRAKRNAAEPLLLELQRHWPDDILLWIEGNEGVLYQAYPFILHPVFPSVPEEAVSRFALACRVYFESAFMADKIVDGHKNYDHGQLYLRAVAMQFEAYRLFQGLFPADSPFWDRFRETFALYTRACGLERRLRTGGEDRSLVTREMSVRIAEGKFPFAAIVVHGMAALAGDQSNVEALAKSIEHFDMASYYWDDLKDWRKDLRERGPSLVVGHVLSARPELREAEEPSAFARALYCDGEAEKVLDVSIAHLDAADALVAHLPLDDWREWLAVFRGYMERARTEAAAVGVRNRARQAAQAPLAVAV